MHRIRGCKAPTAMSDSACSLSVIFAAVSENRMATEVRVRFRIGSAVDVISYGCRSRTHVPIGICGTWAEHHLSIFIFFRRKLHTILVT
jgi:hypothetical protein